MGSRPDGDTAALLRAAERIGARLCRDAIWSGERCAWMAPADEPGPAGTWSGVHRVTGPGLHSGTAGIALFLAHLHAQTGESVFRMTALGAAAHAESRLEDVPPAERTGLHAGWAGIALALDEVAAATGEEGAGQTVRAALEGLAPPEVAGAPGDPAPDVMTGGAGGIAALLRLAGDGGGASDAPSPIVALAVREGERLLALATRGPVGWSWRTIGDAGHPHLCGVSHGAGGIGAALLELAAHTGDERFLEGGRGAFAFESSHFSHEAGGWPDLRIWPGDTAPTGTIAAIWCHGAAGGALARLRALELDPTPRLRAEADRALAACRDAAAADPGEGDPTLCHGAAGIGEALLAGGRALGDARMTEEAVALAARHVEAQEGGAVRRSGINSGLETPSLLLGSAGVGHHLLRLCAPERVPSVLQVTGTAGRQAARAAA
jgi:class II lanthipeptide synthase